MSTAQIRSIEKIETGIPGFDHVSIGGVPKGRVCLVAGTAGSSKTVFAAQFLVEGIHKYGEGGVFVTFEESPADIRRNMLGFHWNIEQLESERKWAFVDASLQPEHEIVEVVLDGSRHPLRLSPRPKAIQGGATQLEAVIAHIQEEVRRAGICPLRGPWLEPLPGRLALDDVRPKRGWDGDTWRPMDRWLCPVLGLRDDPANQRQPLLELELGRRGHLFICSGPGSDSRLPLRTLVASLARDHSPADLHIYCLDFGSFGLQVFENLLHVGAVIHRDEPRRVQRLFRWLLNELASRKHWLAS